MKISRYSVMRTESNPDILKDRVGTGAFESRNSTLVEMLLYQKVCEKIVN